MCALYRVRRYRAQTLPAIHMLAVASIFAHPHPSRWYIGLAHTLNGEPHGGERRWSRREDTPQPSSFPSRRNATPATNGIASPGRCLWRRPTWQLFVLLARRRTQCEGRSTSYVSRRYSRFHLLFLARFIVAAPQAASSFAGQPPEISRCSDPCNLDRMDISIALFSVNARHDPVQSGSSRRPTPDVRWSASDRWYGYNDNCIVLNFTACFTREIWQSVRYFNLAPNSPCLIIPWVNLVCDLMWLIRLIIQTKFKIFFNELFDEFRFFLNRKHRKI